MASEDPFAQPDPSLRVLSNSASTETHAPASASSLSSCASGQPTPSQDSESQQMPMAAMKSEMSQAESEPSTTQRLGRDELEVIQEFQRKHNIVLSRVQLEAVANLLRGVDVLSMWATGTGKSLVFQLVAHILQGLVCNGSVPIRPKAVVFDRRALLCSAEAIFGRLLAPEGPISRTHGLRVSS